MTIASMSLSSSTRRRSCTKFGLNVGDVLQPFVVDSRRRQVRVDVAEGLDLDVLQLGEAALQGVALAADAYLADHDLVVGAEDRARRLTRPGRARPGGRRRQRCPPPPLRHASLKSRRVMPFCSSRVLATMSS